MGLISLVMLIVGVLISTVSGMVCYMGSWQLGGYLDGLPCADLLLTHPAAALGVGGLLTIISAFGQSSRVD